MKKILLIIWREYITRVRSKGFILSTIAAPLVFLVLIVFALWSASYVGGDHWQLLVVDELGVVDSTVETEKFTMQPTAEPLDTLKRKVQRGIIDAVLYLPKLDTPRIKKYTAYLFADKDPDLTLSIDLEVRIKNWIKEYKIQALGLNRQIVNLLRTEVEVDPEPVTEGKKDKSSVATTIASLLSMALGYIIFIVIFMYGSMIMMSVSEEKINRIVEILISTVKPFQLMLGKIVGVGAVGLTQLLIWIVTIPIMLFGLMMVLPYFGMEFSTEGASTFAAPEVHQGGAAMDNETIQLIIQELMGLNWWLILPVFLFYFLGGYFLYGTLFAALGSAVGQEHQENNAFSFIIGLPVILSLYLAMAVVREPHGSLAVWSSIFPLSAPVIMPGRIVFDPPLWQVLLSMVSTVLGIVFFTWVSARIYRVAILMYGKKASIKELWRWLRTP